MKNNNIKIANGRIFNGRPHLKLKRVKASPRQRIWQVLRACLPFLNFKNKVQPGTDLYPLGANIFTSKHLFAARWIFVGRKHLAVLKSGGSTRDSYTLATPDYVKTKDH